MSFVSLPTMAFCRGRLFRLSQFLLFSMLNMSFSMNDILDIAGDDTARGERGIQKDCSF